MEAMEAILSRRSIRKYTSEAISKDVLEKLLKAGMSAPSAGNEQPWHFVVVEDHKILDEVPKFHEYSGMLRGAPLAIVVCCDSLLSKYEHPYWVQDCAAATENILIASNALGLGSVWLGVYPIVKRVEGMRKLLGLPENVIPFSIVVIGHPAENKPPANRFDPLRVHVDKW
jgi:nitroreductase